MGLRILSLVAKPLLRVTAAAILALILACGGGGGGNTGNTGGSAPVTTYTVTAVAGPGTTISPASMTVQSGQTASFTVSLQTGYSNLAVTGGGGTLSGNTYTTGPITANTTVTASATAPPTTYTVTAVAGAGTTISPASLTVQSGQRASFTVSLQTGYSNLAVTGGGGTLSGNTYTTGPITANTTVTASATANPTTYTVTAVAGAGTTISPASLTVQSGQTASFTVSLQTGYSNLAVTGGGGTLSGNTYTTGPIASDCTVTASATKNPPQPIVDVPAVPGKIAYIVAPDVLADMQPLLNQFMDAVAKDTGCANVLMATFTDPLSIRTFLKDQGKDLKVAILIGNVPIVVETTDDVNMSGTSDHYYRALEFNYGIPVKSANGTYSLTIQSNNPYWLESGTLEFASSITTSRIMGLSPATQLADIRTFLEKDLRLRNAHAQYLQGVYSVEAFPYESIPGVLFPMNDIMGAYVNHPILGTSNLTLIHGKTREEYKQAFIDGIHSFDYFKFICHADPFIFELSNDYRTDSIFVPASSLIDNSIRARMASFGGCHVGDFAIWGNTAMRTILNGDTLLVRASPLIAAEVQCEEILHARGFELALGVGRTYASAFPYTNFREWEHLYGDPTITMRIPNLSLPQPRMVIDGKAFHQEFSLPVTLDQTDLSYSNLYAEIPVSNTGDAELVIYGGWGPYHSTTAIADHGDGGRWRWTNPDVLGMSGQYAVPSTTRIAPGETKSIKLLLRQVNDGGTVIGGAQRGFFDFTCNDPRIGAFRIDATGTLSAVAQPTTYTVAIVPGDGTGVEIPFVKVQPGQMGSTRVFLAPGYENCTLVATGMNASISNGICTFGPVNGDGKIYLSAIPK